MKLQRTTLILLLLALSLGGFVYFYEIRGETQRQEAKQQEQQIFSFTEEQVQSFTVKTRKQTLEFERQEAAGKPVWRMKAPQAALASNATVSYLLSLLATGKSDRAISVPTAQLPEYGLAPPQATVVVQLKGQKEHQLVLGEPDFNRNFLYAQADPPAKPAENVEVLLVSTDFGNAVNRSLSEWLQQPDDKAKKSNPTEQPTSAKTK